MDYGRWDRVGDGDEPNAEGGAGEALDTEQDARNLKLLLSKMHLRGTEMLRQADRDPSRYSVAEESFREILRLLSNAKQDMIALLGGREKDILVQSYMGLTCCLIKQDRFDDAVAATSALTQALTRDFPSLDLSIEHRLRLLYFRACALLRSSAWVERYCEAEELAKQIKTILATHTAPNDAMEEYLELFEVVVARKDRAMRSVLTAAEERLSSSAGTVAALLKRQSCIAAADLATGLVLNMFADEYEAALINARAISLAAHAQVAAGYVKEAFQLTERGLLALGRHLQFRRDLITNALATLQLAQWRAVTSKPGAMLPPTDRDGMRRTATKSSAIVVEVLERAVCEELASERAASSGDGWRIARDPGEHFDAAAAGVTQPSTLGQLAVDLVALYEYASAAHRDQQQWKRCFHLLLRVLQLSSRALHLLGEDVLGGVARTVVVLTRSRAKALYCLGTVALQLRGPQLEELGLAQYTNPFLRGPPGYPSAFDAVQDLVLSAGESAKDVQLFACQFLEAAAGAALDGGMLSLAQRAARQCGELLLARYRIEPFHLRGPKADGAERCHDAWRMQAKALTRLADAATGAARTAQLRVDLMLALYQAGLAALMGTGLQDEALRALESAAEARAEVEAVLQEQALGLSADFWLAAGDLSFHLAHCYLCTGRKRYLYEELRRCERHYSLEFIKDGGDPVVLRTRLQHLQLLKAWGLVAERQAEAALELVEAAQQAARGPSEDLSGELADIKRRIAAIQNERTQATVPVSIGRPQLDDDDDDEVARPMNVRLEPLKSLGEERQKWDTDLLLAYCVLLAVAIAVAAVVLRIYFPK